MSSIYVSSYDEVFMKAFSKGVDTMPDKTNEVVKEFTDIIHDKVLDKLFNYIADEMKLNLDSVIRDKASEVAESMLMNALAGDDKTIRNLFDFNDWYMKHLYIGKQPTQWRLIDAIIERNPDLFVDEIIKQQQAQIHQLTENYNRANQYNKELREKYEGYRE